MIPPTLFSFSKLFKLFCSFVFSYYFRGNTVISLSISAKVFAWILSIGQIILQIINQKKMAYSGKRNRNRIKDYVHTHGPILPTGHPRGKKDPKRPTRPLPLFASLPWKSPQSLAGSQDQRANKGPSSTHRPPSSMVKNLKMPVHFYQF